MGITLATPYPNPYDPATPFVGAYAWIAGLSLDTVNGAGRMVLNVHPSAAASEAGRPLGQINVGLGDVYQPADPTADPPLPEVRFPILAEFMADPEFRAAYETVAAKLYAAAIAIHPQLAGASTP